MSQGKDFSKVKQFNGQAQAPARKDNTTALINLLSKNMKAIKSALPRHLTAERIARVALNNIRHNPKLMQCAPETLCYAIMEAASLGLEIDMRGQAYLVPFWNNKTRSYDVQLLIGYRGLLDLVWRSGQIQSIMADVVGENDKFNVVQGLEQKLEHIPNFTEGRGEIIAAYAVAIMKDGAKHFLVMPRADLDKIRAASKSADSGPWVQWPEEMMKKSILKRLCKFLPLSPEIQRATTVDDQADAGVVQSLAETIIDIPITEPQLQEPEEEPQSELEPENEAHESSLEDNITRPELIPPRNGKKQQQVDASYSFKCPANGKEVTEEDCASCKSRNGCPAFEV